MFEDGMAAYHRGDYATALEFWRPLAEQGDANAQRNLGVMYENGQSVPQDYAEALTWYHKAAEQGDAAAQYNLGTMYYNGLGVPQEHILGCMWFDIAAASGSESAINSPDFFARMSPDEIAVAKRMAREWMAEHQQ
jgi:TPR repeat protein